LFAGGQTKTTIAAGVVGEALPAGAQPAVAQGAWPDLASGRGPLV